MLGGEVAGEHLDDAVAAVEEDVEGEVDARRLGDLADGVVHGVAGGDTPGRTRVADAPGVVQGKHRVEPGQPGSDQLRAPAEAGEEVRLDEPRGDPHVGIDPRLVQRDGYVAGEPPDPAERGGVAGVVVDDPHTVEDVGTEHRLELGRGVRPMGAGGDENHDVVRIDDAVELVEQRRDHHSARLGSGAVAHRDRHGLAGAHSFAQRCAGGGVPQRRVHGPSLVGHGGELSWGDDGGAFGGHVDDEAGLAVGELDLHGIARSWSPASP